MPIASRFVRRAIIALCLVLVFTLVSGVVFYLQPLWVADHFLRVRLWNHDIQSRYAEVGGYRIHYLEALPHGGGPGTPLVLVHGLGSRGEDWIPLIPGLTAAGFHVYAPDLLGYGASPQPDVDYSISLQEKLVLQFLDAMRLSRVNLGGWSMGGWIAARFALDHPERVERLVLYDSAGIYFPATFDASLFIPADAAGLVHLTAMLDPHPKPFPDFVSRAIVQKLQRNGWIIHRAVDSMTSGRDLLDFRLSALRTPTLIVWGSEDVLIPLSVGETMHRLIPDSSLDVLDGCGHLAPGQCPHSALTATLDFLKTPTPPARVERTLPGN